MYIIYICFINEVILFMFDQYLIHKLLFLELIIYFYHIKTHLPLNTIFSFAKFNFLQLVLSTMLLKLPRMLQKKYRNNSNHLQMHAQYKF